MASSFNPLTSAGDCGILEEALLRKEWSVRVLFENTYDCSLGWMGPGPDRGAAALGGTRAEALVSAALVVIP
jgi:hypothetical protein